MSERAGVTSNVKSSQHAGAYSFGFLLSKSGVLLALFVKQKWCTVSSFVVSEYITSIYICWYMSVQIIKWQQVSVIVKEYH